MTQDEKRRQQDESVKYIPGNGEAYRELRKKVEQLMEEAGPCNRPGVLLDVVDDLYKKEGYSSEEIKPIVKRQLALAMDWKANQEFREKVERLVEAHNSCKGRAELFKGMYQLFKKEGYSDEDIERIVLGDVELETDWKACVKTVLLAASEGSIKKAQHGH